MRKSLLGYVALLSCCFMSALVAHVAIAQERLPKLKLVTADRIAQLAAPERAQWESYVQQSQSLALSDRAELAKELASAKLSESIPAPNSSLQFDGSGRKANDAWFESDEARNLVPVVLSYQTPSGGWSKSVD